MPKFQRPSMSPMILSLSVSSVSSCKISVRQCPPPIIGSVVSAFRPRRAFASLRLCVESEVLHQIALNCTKLQCF